MQTTTPRNRTWLDVPGVHWEFRTGDRDSLRVSFIRWSAANANYSAEAGDVTASLVVGDCRRDGQVIHRTLLARATDAECVEYAERAIRHHLHPDVDECDFCGKSGCRWQNHAEARADVAAWQRSVAIDTAS